MDSRAFFLSADEVRNALPHNDVADAIAETLVNPLTGYRQPPALPELGAGVFRRVYKGPDINGRECVVKVQKHTGDPHGANDWEARRWIVADDARSLLAEVLGVSEDRTVLLMEYVPLSARDAVANGILPREDCRAAADAAQDILGESGWDMRDLHDGNYRFKNDGTLLVTDYGDYGTSNYSINDFRRETQ